MPYFNTNDKNLATGFVEYINKKLGYNGAKFYTRYDIKFIKKYGLHRIGINVGQSAKTGIEPKIGSMFTEEEVKKFINGD